MYTKLRPIRSPLGSEVDNNCRIATRFLASIGEDGMTMHTEKPGYPVHALTTYELRRYRRALEHSLKCIPAGTPVRDLLHTRLAEVLAEEECRAQLQVACGR